MVRSIGATQPLGTSMLIFVGGVGDITDLSELFEALPRYRVIPLHADLPLEEQELALVPPAGDEIKVIIATDTAASR